MNRKRHIIRLVLFSLIAAALTATACAPMPGLTFPGQSSPAAQQGSGSGQVPSTGAGGTGAASGTGANSSVPSVTVNDQNFDGTTVVVADVVSKGPGWMVIHSQINGVVGPVLGFTHVNDGDNKNVTVKLDQGLATPVMYAMLHTDAGKVGTYEYPGPDVPVSVDGQMLTPPFKVTKQSATSSITPAVKVNNQVVKDGQVVIAEVDSPGPAWIAIHLLKPDGTPGEDIGFTGVKPGKNMHVTVTVDQARVTQTMFAMLHIDDGEIGTYEFPAHDGPMMVNGAMIAPAFASDGTTPAVSASMGTHDMSSTSTSTPSGTMVANEVYPTATATSAAAQSQPASTATQTPAMADMAGPTPTPARNMTVQTPAPGVNPMVMVSDQPVVNGMVKVDEVVSGGPGWIVIYTTTANGQPDQAIGHAAVQQGDNKNVMVPVDPSMAKGKLYAQLHVDAGKAGVFEFPGPDNPLMVGIQMISNVFNITSGAAAAHPTAAPTATGMASIVMPTAPPGSPSSTMPFIKVADQPIINATIVIPEVFSVGDAWLVIHRQNGDGTEGPMVGYVRVKDGDNTNIPVRVDTRFTSTTMYAMLHDDKGKIGKLEFPGPDQPTMANGVMVNMPFTITGNKSADVVVNLSKDANATQHLVDGYDMSLYLSLNDRPNKSNCTGDCQSTWKPVLANGRVVAGSGVASNKLGIILLPDGTRQVTYAGAPLYTYTDDSKPGDINGQGLDGAWFLVSP